MLKKEKFPTPAKYKGQFPFLKEVDSLALANAQINLQTAYKNFFEGNAKFPKFKNCKARQSYMTNLVHGNFELKDGHINLPKLLVKIKQHREIPENYKLKSCTILKTNSGKYYVSVLTEYEKEIKLKLIENVIGLDFAMAELYVSSENEKANYPRYYRVMSEKLAKAQRILSKRKKGSARWNKQRIVVAKLHESGEPTYRFPAPQIKRISFHL